MTTSNKKSCLNTFVALFISLCSGAAFYYCYSEYIGYTPIRVVIDDQGKAGTGRSNDLMTYFLNNKDKGINKWLHYFEVYDRHFSKFRGKSPTVLEIGVAQGGSLQMWKNYFGPGTVVVGLDIDENCKSLEEPDIHIHIGDQADKKFLADVISKYPKIDIVIDDGGHFMNQQITSFQELYPHVSEDGVYLCEDTHTSYLPAYEGGLRRQGTFMEMSKGLIDQLNAWHFPNPEDRKDSAFSESTYSMHFYTSIVVIEKRRMTAPIDKFIGEKSIPDYWK